MKHAILTLAGGILAATVAMSAVAAADPLPVATGARIVGDAKKTRFVADLSRKLDVTAFVLGNPYRAIIDLTETRFEFKPGSGSTGRGLVTAWRYGLFAKGKSRLVLDLAGPARIEKAFVVPPVGGQPARLVVDLASVSQQAFAAQWQRQREERVKTTPPVGVKGNRLVPSDQETAKPVIVIDPGHGGIDMGAIGHSGIAEKTVVLAFSKLLKQTLEETGRYSVVMTRNSDTFMALRERVEFARRHQAGLFISVHADSIRSRSVRGATVYTLSKKASDRQAALLAEKENAVDIISGLELEDEPREVTDILVDLTRRETKTYSVHFARTLVGYMGRSQRLIKTNPHRSAGFRVLRAHDVPSVLLELGYISNAEDEKLLTTREWQTKMVASVIKSVDAFFEPRVSHTTQ